MLPLLILSSKESLPCWNQHQNPASGGTGCCGVFGPVPLPLWIRGIINLQYYDDICQELSFRFFILFIGYKNIILFPVKQELTGGPPLREVVQVSPTYTRSPQPSFGLRGHPLLNSVESLWVRSHWRRRIGPLRAQSQFFMAAAKTSHFRHIFIFLAQLS